MKMSQRTNRRSNVDGGLGRTGLALRRQSLAVLAVMLFILVNLSACLVNPEKETLPKATAEKSASGQLANDSKTNPTGPALTLQDLSVREDQGQTSVFLKFSQPVSEFRHFPLPNPSRIVLDIFNSANRVAPPASYRIDTHWLSTLRLTNLDGSVRLTIDVAAATVPAYRVVPEDNGIRLVIGDVNPSFTTKKDAILVRAGARIDIRVPEATATTDKISVARPLGTDKVIGEDKKYTGQKISLEFKDADIKNVFRLLGEVSGKNIVVTDDVKRKVTVRLIEVPWDQALEVIIDTNGLGKDESGNVIRISTAGQLKTERDERAAAKKSGENLEPLQTAYLTVNYAKVMKGQGDTSTDKDLVEKVKALLSPRGKVEADQRTNTLIVRDIKSSVEDIQNLIGRLDLRTPQVLIESNLIETTPTFTRSLGIEMESLFNNGRIRTSDRFLANSPFRGDPQPTPAANLLSIPNPGFRFGYFGNNITSVLSAAEAEGNVKIISRPSVVTLNNVESQIESARIIRIRTSAATVGESGSLREIRAGIILKVTPQVSADGFVLLNISVKSSTLDFGNTIENIPAENSREAKANVLVRDGETVVIGGILKDTSSNSDTGIPYLKDVPVLGWLFKKSSWTKDFEELVVFITPRIMSAGAENLPSAEQIWRDQLKQTDGPAPAQTSLKP
jgi:type IV pilus secretin PilQ/predicted competence protein